MKIYNFIQSLLVISLFVLYGFCFAQGGTPDIIDNVSPSSAEVGTQNLHLTITLKNLTTPPIPSSEISLSYVKIGSVSGRNLSRNGLTITAVFDIPENESIGPMDVIIAFLNPRSQTVEFVKSSAFQITGNSNDQSNDNEPADVTPNAGDYVIVDTGQEICYNNSSSISAPQAGAAFYGQDAQFDCAEPVYRDNGDGTVTDLNTGLMWQQDLSPDKYTFDECVEYAANSTLAGYTDWRLPTIKELYSLILFSGKTGRTTFECIPYIDMDYFNFRFGGAVNASERIIDAQYATSTIYKGTTMNGNETMFGVNFVDGRIKGYPTSKDFEIKLVRGIDSYGLNDFEENGDGTISDRATGLMWGQAGSSRGMNWQDALDWAQQKNAQNYLGYSDWRLPNAKELQSIVDYERSPSYTNSAAIDPLFNMPQIINEAGEKDYPFYWTSTTHVDGPGADKAVYIAFGRALGYMHNVWMDVHGAGAQRSDPKDGDPDDYPSSFGPQGDVSRVFNYVRLVRTSQLNTSCSDKNIQSDCCTDDTAMDTKPEGFELYPNSPNPFNPVTSITFVLQQATAVELSVFNLHGQKIKTLASGVLPAGQHHTQWDATNQNGERVASGVYLYQMIAGDQRLVKKMSLMR